MFLWAVAILQQLTCTLLAHPKLPQVRWKAQHFLWVSPELAQGTGGWRNVCSSPGLVWVLSFIPASLQWYSLPAKSCGQFLRARGSRWWRAASGRIGQRQSHLCHPGTPSLTHEKLESHGTEAELPGCFVQNPWNLLLLKFRIGGIRSFFPAVCPVPLPWAPFCSPSIVTRTPGHVGFLPHTDE